MQWMENAKERPLMSNDIFKTQIFPALDNKEKVFCIVIDNLRYDHWKILANEISNMFEIKENMYMSILPTATQYSRNAIFSGLMPYKIQKMYPNLWVDEDEDEGKNLNEEALIQTQFERYRRHDTFSYHKINDSQAINKLIERFGELEKYDLNVVVINFIDMLSHARTESKMVKLANNESAYRSITQSWLRHSDIAELFRLLSQKDYKVIITTDHGSIRANKPIKIIGDRNTNTNLGYKQQRISTMIHVKCLRLRTLIRQIYLHQTSAHHMYSLQETLSSLIPTTITSTMCHIIRIRFNMEEYLWKKCLFH